MNDELLDTIQMIATIDERNARGSCLWELTQKKRPPWGASVGADAGQSIQKESDNSIPVSEAKRNGETENSTESLEEMYRKMQRMADPRYLHTLTMTELFQTSYKSRPPHY